MPTATTRPAAATRAQRVEALPATSCSSREAVVFLVVSFGLFALMASAADVGILFARHFWLDEYLTALIVTDPSTAHAMAAVRGGVDTNPPVYHLILRAFQAMIGGYPEVGFRGFSALCTWLALIATYAVLRRSFAVVPAALAMLSLVAHRLILKESFEARFYAPLLAAVAGFMFFFGQSGSGSGSESRGARAWVRDVMVALMAVLTCTLHYFGIFALVTVVMGEWLVSGSSRAFLRRLLPIAAGPAALAAMAPFLLGQRRGLSVSTWMPEVTLEGAAAFVEAVFYATPIVLVLLAWCVSQFRRSPAARAAATEGAAPAPPLAPVAGMFALAAIPFMVLLFSIAVQPALGVKYAIPAALALAPAVALLAGRLRPALSAAVALLLVLLALSNVRDLARVSRERHNLTVGRALRCQAFDDALPIVSINRENAYLLQYVAPELAPRLVLADVRPLGGGGDFTNYYRYEMDMARKVQRFYPVPRVVDAAGLAELGPFHFDGTLAEFETVRRHLRLHETKPGLWKVE